MWAIRIILISNEMLIAIAAIRLCSFIWIRVAAMQFFSVVSLYILDIFNSYSFKHDCMRIAMQACLKCSCVKKKSYSSILSLFSLVRFQTNRNEYQQRQIERYDSVTIWIQMCCICYIMHCVCVCVLSYTNWMLTKRYTQSKPFVPHIVDVE